MIAVIATDLETVRLALKAGTNIDPLNQNRQTAYDLGNNEIGALIAEYEKIRNNIGKLENLRKHQPTYLFVIPKDLVGLIKNQLTDENFY